MLEALATLATAALVLWISAPARRRVRAARAMYRTSWRYRQVAARREARRAQPHPGDRIMRGPDGVVVVHCPHRSETP